MSSALLCLPCLPVAMLRHVKPTQPVWHVACDVVSVQILEVSPDQSGPGFRVHGSIRLVDQTDGADLDPSGQLAAAAAARGPGEQGGCKRGRGTAAAAVGNPCLSSSLP